MKTSVLYIILSISLIFLNNIHQLFFIPEVTVTLRNSGLTLKTCHPTQNTVESMEDLQGPSEDRDTLQAKDD